MPAELVAGRLLPSSRIKKRLEFEAAQNGGRRATTAHFVLLLYARGEDGPARLGIVASRKIGNAVVRNRAKRLVREGFRAARSLFAPGIDVVVIVRRPLEAMKLGDVVAEWRRAASAVERRTVEAKADLRKRPTEETSARSSS